MNIYQEKIAQAVSLLADHDLDMWLILVRETAEHTDPVLKLIGHYSQTWTAAFIFTRQGDTIAVTGHGDDEAIRRQQLYGEVRDYTQSIGPVLREIMQQYDPQRIGINYSRSDVSADGLTLGMYQNLLEYLKDTPYVDRLVSAESFIESLRGRKTPLEVQRLRKATDVSFAILGKTWEYLQAGVSEQEVAAYVHSEVAAAGGTTSWDIEHCPGINAGPNSPWGHVGPSLERLQAGQTFHMDFGVMIDGYCSDHQRMWYCLKPGETQAPAEVITIFNAVKHAVHSAKAAVKPGVIGWEIDAIARKAITDAGYPEYPHALGHQVGRYVHDGGVGFYPRWERYGTKPYGTIEAGMVLTLELGVRSPFGYISLEEQILVTDNGCEWIGDPQQEIWLIGANA